MLPPVALKNLHGIFSVISADLRDKHHKQAGNSRRNEVQNIIQPGREGPEPSIPVIDVPDHGIHRIDGLVEKSPRSSADHQKNQRRHNAVRGVFRDGLDRRLCDSCHIQFFCIPPHNHGDCLSGSSKISGLHLPVNLHALIPERSRRQNLITPERLDSKAKPEIDVIEKFQKNHGNQSAHRHDTERGQNACCPLSCFSGRENLPEELFKKGNKLSDKLNRVVQTVRIPEHKVQNSTEQYRWNDMVKGFY